MVDTATVLSDIPLKTMTPQAEPSNFAYEIETHVGGAPPVGIARTPPTIIVDRMRSFMLDIGGERAGIEENIFARGSQPRALWYLF